MDNVDLTDAILSRFDILCVLKDEIQDSKDRQLATFVINSHIKNHPSMNKESMSSIFLKDPTAQKKKPTINQDLLKKYILYARNNIHPKLSNIDRRKISNFYSKLREEQHRSGGLGIAVRHIESILRMSEASAKMHLREYVRGDDIDFAIGVLLDSFIQS